VFHQLNRIVLAGITVAVMAAAMTAPASARASASAQSSTPVPVDITGDITWTLDHHPTGSGFPNFSGDDKETGTYHIDLTNVTNGGLAVGGNSSTYSVTDNLNWTFGGDGGCTVTDTGSFTGSGPLLLPTAQSTWISVAFNPSMTAISATINDYYVEAATRTFTGPYSTCTGTVAEPLGPEGQPGCLDSSGNNLGLNGSLTGTYPNATVDLGCSGTYTGGGTFTGGPDTGSYSVTGTLTITPACGDGAASSPAPSGSCPFTVNGDQPGHPVESNSSQDTHATDPQSVCNPEAAKVARDVGQLAEAYMLLRGAPDGAGLLRHFLADSGDPVEFPQGSAPSNELAGNPSFVSLKDAVLDEIGRQLELGLRTVDLNGFLQAMTPPTLNSPIDLYYAFRGTQGITVSGSGTVNGDGSYSGTLTYTILDSYGFTVLDALNLPFRTGALMRYLQINCGDNPLGAHWFPDYITLTQNFSGQL
jgi:hypothetical protein